MKYEYQELGQSAIQIIDGDRGKNYPNGSDFSPVGYCLFLNAKNVTADGFSFSERSFISREKDNLLRKGKLIRKDTVLTTRGTVGNVAYFSDDVPYPDMRINSGMVILRPNLDVFDSEFVYWLFRSNIVQNQIVQLRSGTAQPQLPISSLQRLNIPIPTIDIQKAIVAIIGTLQRKIELNQKINRNLYAQAGAIFNEHFIGIDNLPTGWKVGTLLDIADYLNGLAMQRYRPNEGESGIPVLKIKELRQGFCDSSSELCSPTIKPEYIIRDGDVVFSWSGSLLVDFWCGGTCGLNQHLFKVTSERYDKWFYYHWTVHHLDRFIAIAADKATTMGHIKREELSKAEVLIPTDSDYKEISAHIKPIVDLIIANRIENQTLAQLRDRLLPKLMSGEIDTQEVC